LLQCYLCNHAARVTSLIVCMCLVYIGTQARVAVSKQGSQIFVIIMTKRRLTRVARRATLLQTMTENVKFGKLNVFCFFVSWRQQGQLNCITILPRTKFSDPYTISVVTGCSRDLTSQNHVLNFGTPCSCTCQGTVGQI
jgi:hypothetical protein